MSDSRDFIGVPRIPLVKLKFTIDEDFARVDPDKEKSICFKHAIPYNPYKNINKYYNDNKFVDVRLSNAILKNGEKDYVYGRLTIAYDYKNNALILCDLGDEAEYCSRINSIRSKWLNPSSLRKDCYHNFIMFHLSNIYWNFYIIEPKGDPIIYKNEKDNSIAIPVTIDDHKYFVIIDDLPEKESGELSKKIRNPQYVFNKDNLSSRLYISYYTYPTDRLFEYDKFVISEFEIKMDRKGRISAKENVLLERKKYSNQKIDFTLTFTNDSISRWADLIDELKDHRTPAQQRIWNFLNDNLKQELTGWKFQYTIKEDIKKSVVEALNELLNEWNFYDSESFEKVKIDKEAKSLLKKGVDNLSEDEIKRLNRLLLEAIFPDYIAKSRLDYIPVE